MRAPPGQKLLAGRWLFSPAGTAWAWDDLQLVGLKLIFFVAIRVVSLLGSLSREWPVEGRRDPDPALTRSPCSSGRSKTLRLSWAGRAALAALARAAARQPAPPAAPDRLPADPAALARRPASGRRWTHRRCAIGRPRTAQTVRAPAAGDGQGQPGLGYRRIDGDLARPGPEARRRRPCGRSSKDAWHRPRARTDRADLAGVPGSSGQDDPCN